MHRNVEIKARVTDPRAVLRRARELAGGGVDAERHVQRDVFFHVSSGRLKLRVSGHGDGELIYYERPDAAGPTVSRYHRSPLADPERAEALLAAALGKRGVVRKLRRVHLVGQTRVHVDEVEGLGAFLELEVVLGEEQSADDGTRIARRLLASLGVTEDQLVRGAYIDLLENAERAG